MEDDKKTIIRFVFRKPIGFYLPNHGNFMPDAVIEHQKTPFHEKPVPKLYYNMAVEKEVRLPSEFPRELPAYLAGADEETRRAFRVEQMKEAANNHAANNAIRDILAQNESEGIIEVIYDSFKDENLGKSKKAVKAVDSADTVVVKPANAEEIVKKTGARKPGRPAKS